MKTTRRKKSEVTKNLATFLSPKCHFAELHYIAALCIRAAPTAKVRVGHFCGPRVAIPTEQQSLCPRTSQILWRRGKGEQTPLPGGGGTGRCLPTRRSCPLPGGTRTERSTQGKARAGHGLPGVLAGRTLESGGLFRRLHVREASAVGLGERQAHSEERGRLPALWGRPCQEPGRQGGVSRAHKDHHACWSV